VRGVAPVRPAFASASSIHVEKAFEADACCEQTQFLGGACLGQVFDPFPHFGRAQVEIFDCLEQVGGEPQHNLLHAGIGFAFCGVDDEPFHEGFNFCMLHCLLLNSS
jgi:hypothetical protein